MFRRGSGAVKSVRVGKSIIVIIIFTPFSLCLYIFNEFLFLILLIASILCSTDVQTDQMQKKRKENKIKRNIYIHTLSLFLTSTTQAIYHSTSTHTGQASHSRSSRQKAAVEHGCTCVSACNTHSHSRIDVRVVGMRPPVG